MINRKYIELINKEIDNEISDNEKILLDNYLKMNPEAEELRKELLQAEAALENLPDITPSVNLKKRILNSINFNRYSHKEKPSSIKNFVVNTFTNPLRGFAVSFSMGIIAGIIVLSIIFLNTDLLRVEKDVPGTMGISGNNLTKSIAVDVSGVSGKIDVLRNPGSYGFNVELNSFEDFALQLICDTKQLEIKDFSSGNQNVTFQKEDSYILITAPGYHSYSFFLSFDESVSRDFTLKLKMDDHTFFEQDIEPGN